MSQIGRFRPNVKTGNWYEDQLLQEDAIKQYLEKKERGELTFQKRDLLKQTILQQAPCGVSAGRNVQPRTRTAFIITSVDGSPEGSTLCFDQSFTLKTTSGFASGLYLKSDLQRFQKCAKMSRLQEVYLDENDCFLSWWKIVHFDPLERLEYEGQPVPADVKVLIVHCKTNQALAVLGDHVLWTTYGKEYEVTAHTFLDSHKAEKDNNHWILCTSDPEEKDL
ncbi:cilia- and flagella-associated protein 161 isoform X2 [Melanotaenia boesemani]|uniref:cilia- and flagella-associated protein 161 isoform X2 n=1 Tax=Melanotaenia boesemani TaxID=1250792 RepID=UPI001C041E48|nr:cilia- and flagella-associated protein 161 isoform X2 [Melanotaenia boesemani]